VRKDLKLQWPRAETPDQYIAMGLDEDLNKAVRLAVDETVDFLMTAHNLSRADAYMLASVAVNLHITVGGQDQRRPRHDPQEYF
jgi:acetamidase/formamidase